MTYDPNRTNMLPDMGPSFPITEELPPVAPRRGPGGRGFLGLVAFLLVAAIAGIAAILVIDNQRSDDVATGDEEPTPTVEADPGDTTAPTPPQVDDGEPGYWRVVNVPDGLNVRSGPGTDNDIVGALGADARHILGTGRRSDAGGEWIEIRYDAADRVGWVSGRFLAVDTPPGEGETEPTPTPTAAPSGATSTVCFRSDGDPTRVARLVFTDRTDISGLLRSIGSETTSDQSVEGTLDNGVAEMVLTDQATNARSRQTWTFNTTNVDLGNGRTLDVVDCGSVASSLG